MGRGGGSAIEKRRQGGRESESKVAAKQQDEARGQREIPGAPEVNAIPVMTSNYFNLIFISE